MAKSDTSKSEYPTLSSPLWILVLTVIYLVAMFLMWQKIVNFDLLGVILILSVPIDLFLMARDKKAQEERFMAWLFAGLGIFTLVMAILFWIARYS